MTAMKKMIFILLGLLMITSASATDDMYLPLVREGVTWYYLRYLGLYNTLYISTDYLYSYNCDGDTAVLDKDMMKNYKKVVYQEYDNQNNVTYSAMLRAIREESKVVYVKPLFDNLHEFSNEVLDKPVMALPYWAGWDEENSQYYDYYTYYEDPIYDFNRESFLPDDHGSSHYFRKNCTATSVTINGVDHNAYAIDDGVDYYTATVIEGIGIDSGAGQLLAPQSSIATGAYHYDGLAWVEENGKIIYKGVMYDKAMEYLGTVTDISTIEGDKQVLSVRYYNLAGVESAEPQQGVNIKVTTYTDGTRKCEKVLRQSTM